jgi:hypothetical protein
MMMNPTFLEAESAVVRAYAPRQGRPMLRGELQEQARWAFAARVRKRDQKNVQSSAALEAKALGGGGVEVPVALGDVTALEPKALGGDGVEVPAALDLPFTTWAVAKRN